MESSQSEHKEESTFSHGEIFRLRSSIVEIIECLKLKQAVERDNEDHINQLLSEKYELERKLESEKRSRQVTEEQHQQESVHIKQLCEDKLRALEVEQKQFSVLNNCAEKEIMGLKEEARTAQLSKYKLEKRVKELESKLSSQETSSETQLRQLTGLEKKMATVKSYFQRLEGSLSRLDKNGWCRWCFAV